MRRRRTTAVVLAVVIAAGCATASGVTSRQSMQTPESVEATPATEAGDTAPVGTDSPNDPANPDDGIEIGDSNLRTGVLANGLTYYIRNNDNPGGSAELRLAVNAGSAREDEDQSGVAHFLEHMMFNGTEQFPKNDLIEILRQSGAQFGADINAYTSYDETVYQLNVQTRDPEPLETGLDVLAQWLTAATLDPVEVEKERGVVLDEWRRTEQSADGRVSDAIEGLFLTGSPYEGRDPIGTDTAISSMTPDLLRRFYDQWYRPDNAAVVVVGAIDVDDVERGIRDRFAAAEPRADSATGVELDVGPFATTSAAVHPDPDITTPVVEVALPLPAVAPSSDSHRDATLDQLIFTIIANRLSDDAVRGDQPFDDAYVSNDNLVRAIDAPSVAVDSKSDRETDSMLILLDEFERVRRFGFDDAEVSRAVSEVEGAATADHESDASRQDAQFADGYVDVFLRDELVRTADADYDFVIRTLRAVTPEALAERFDARWANSSPHVLIVAPERESAGLPTVDDVDAAVEALATRDLEARTPTEEVPDELMNRPQPVDEIDSESLQSFPQVYVDHPLQLTFANGVRVIFNNTPIVEQQFVLEARSPGGNAAVADDDVADANLAVDVVTNSGVGDFDKAQLNQILSGSTAAVSMFIGSSSDEIYGSASSADMEQLLQLIHLYMTAARVDQASFDRSIADARATAADPSADPQAAGYDALLRLRYGDDTRFGYQLDADEVDSIDQAGVRRVWTQRFANASDWTFVISGDYDREAAEDLARSYLGTLPDGGTPDPLVDIEPPPPSGVNVDTVHAGEGEKATLLRLYTTDTDDSVENTVLADVAAELLTNRLLVRIREELGESYAPSANIAITPAIDDGPSVLDTFIEISTAPDQVEPVSTILTAEIGDLVGAGATADEVDTAISVVFEHYNLISNEALADALLGTATGIGATLETYVGRYDTIDDVQPSDIDAFFRGSLPVDRYVEVQVLPR